MGRTCWCQVGQDFIVVLIIYLFSIARFSKAPPCLLLVYHQLWSAIPLPLSSFAIKEAQLQVIKQINMSESTVCTPWVLPFASKETGQVTWGTRSLGKSDRGLKSLEFCLMCTRCSKNLNVVPLLHHMGSVPERRFASSYLHVSIKTSMTFSMRFSFVKMKRCKMWTRVQALVWSSVSKMPPFIIRIA